MGADTALHRLSAQHFQTTRTEQEWSRLPFQGNLTRQVINARQTVVAIKRLGGNIDLLTRPQPGSRHRNTSHTPLMMAGLGARPEVVEALLNEGANPHIENNFGETALFCLSQERDEDTRTVQLLCLAGANANHKDHEGIGALINAGLFHLVEVVDMLLAYGADILERYHQRPESPYIGGNVFALLSTLPGRLGSQDLEGQYEHSVAKLLTKYVCSNTDAHVQQQVVNGVDNYDRTLLWHYSANRMQHCVAALIANGADVNAAGLQFRHRRLLSREKVIDVWRETPLDAALRSKSSLIDDMERDRHLPISEFNDHCRIYDIIIAALRGAGGVSAGKQIKTFPRTIDNVAEEMPGWVESMKRCGNI
ncbi:ankyrin repeat-containing domain protein [Xylaria scruposa]|nr:ankyrin repeat-containing domain protein [Xylaria scruposa]